MSFPNIPDIDPEIELNINDIVNLLLASIAFEELGLAHVINAEAEKIQSVLGTLEGQTIKNPTVADLERINKAVEKVLRDVISEEMLLEFKLEEVLSILTSTTTSTSSSTSTTTTRTTSTTTTTTTTTSTTTTRSTTTRDPACGIAAGSYGSGQLTSGDIRFLGGIANIQNPCIYDMCGSGMPDHLAYRVTRGEKTLTMVANLDSIKVQCPDPFNPNPSRWYPNTLIVTGEGDIELHDSNTDIIGTGIFHYYFNDGGTKQQADSFRIIIMSSNPKLNHNSSVVVLDGNLTVIDCH